MPKEPPCVGWTDDEGGAAGPPPVVLVEAVGVLGGASRVVRRHPQLVVRPSRQIFMKRNFQQFGDSKIFGRRVLCVLITFSL